MNTPRVSGESFAPNRMPGRHPRHARMDGLGPAKAEAGHLAESRLCAARDDARASANADTACLVVSSTSTGASTIFSFENNQDVPATTLTSRLAAFPRRRTQSRRARLTPLSVDGIRLQKVEISLRGEDDHLSRDVLDRSVIGLL